VPRTNTHRPVFQGPLHSWLSARSMQAEVDKAAKLLALAETPTKIASQVQDHAPPLACMPACLLARMPARPLASPPARWHARLPVCPPARPPACTSAH
jgi:hypothetical protein